MIKQIVFALLFVSCHQDGTTTTEDQIRYKAVLKTDKNN